MVPRLAGASLGLLAFAITVLAGLFVGNPASVVLSRAVLSLFLFFVVGLLLGFAAQVVLAERYRKREQELIKQYQTSVDEGEAELPVRTDAPKQRVAGGGVTA